MGRHRDGIRHQRFLLSLAIATAVVVAAAFAVVGFWSGADLLAGSRTDSTTDPAGGDCDTVVRVVTAASFAPVLTALDPILRGGRPCTRFDVAVADGRSAVETVARTDAHLWIPDDGAWAGVGAVRDLGLAPSPPPAVLATSPLYLVADRDTARKVGDAGGSWLGLARLAGNGEVRVVLRDPAGSGDGLVAAGAIGEAVWLDAGMDASAQALAAALPHTRTVPGARVATPEDPGEVGVVPEYALRDGVGDGTVVLAPADHTAQLRYTWLPTANAAGDPVVAAALWRTRELLLGEQAAAAYAAAGLRGPGDADPAATPATPATPVDPAGPGPGPGPGPGATTDATTAADPNADTNGAGPPAGLPDGLPEVSAPAFEVLAPHHVEHVFATWYPQDRRSDVLLVIDVSGSMGQPTAGTGAPLMDVVRAGCDQLAALLPDDARVGVWEFGSSLQPPLDHRVLLEPAVLDAAHRGSLAAVTAALTAQRTGTGLYDTVLAAYTAARDGYRAGVPNHVLLFTDGRNEDDPGSLTVQQLTDGLRAARDPDRPVQLTVVTFGPDPEVDVLTAALAPVDGYVDPLATADEVSAVFIHVAAGGLHH